MVDVNGTRYHLFLTPEDWAGALQDGNPTWEYNLERHAVTLKAQPFVFPSHASDPVLTTADRRGATRDTYGHWYWVDEDERQIRVRWIGASAGDHYWSSADPQPCPPEQEADKGGFVSKMPPPRPILERLAGLAATKGHYLVAGSPDRGELLIFDLHTGGALPKRIRLPNAPDGTPTIPFDVAPLNGGGVIVLDRENRIAWALDADFRLLPLPAVPNADALLFQPKVGETRTEWRAPIIAPIRLDDCIDPISIEPLPDGSYLVLDQTSNTTPSILRRYVSGVMGAVGSVELIETNLRAGSSAPLQLAPIIGHDMAFVSGGAEINSGTLFIVNTRGNQAFAFDIRLDLGLTVRARTKFFPIRGYTGRALVAPLGDVYAYYDQGERWLPLAALPRQRYETTSEIVLPVLDGRDPNCVWHRLCMDACIPPETRVQVYTRTADNETGLDIQPWDAEPLPYRRGNGAEIPYYRLWSEAESRQPDTGTWELLFQRAHGRYLQICLVLTGNARSTPAIRALRAHFPRFSYLTRYLPALYGQDAVSASFIERFLANPEGMLTTLEGMIADSQVFFDVRTTDAVEWLGAWLGLAFDATWSDYQRRLMIAHAPYFFLRRGTLAGVIQAIQIALDPRPEIFTDDPDTTCSRVRILERFQTRYRTDAGMALGDPNPSDTPLTGDVAVDAGVRAHRFIVLLPATLTTSQIDQVEQIVQLEKPAHTDFIIRQFWALFRVGEVRLGLDTTLGEGGRFETIRLGETALAEGTLGIEYPYNLTDRTVLGQ